MFIHPKVVLKNKWFPDQKQFNHPAQAQYSETKEIYSFSIFQKVSFSYDAATIMFCSLYGFSELIDKMDPLKVRKMLWIKKYYLQVMFWNYLLFLFSHLSFWMIFPFNWIWSLAILMSTKLSVLIPNTWLLLESQKKMVYKVVMFIPIPYLDILFHLSLELINQRFLQFHMTLCKF